MNSRIDAVAQRINKKYGDGTLVRVSQAKGLFVRKFSTGSAVLDVALGGGIPLGRITEIVGQYSSYKTTLALIVCKQFLSLDKSDYILWIDAERVFDPRWAKFLGCDQDRIHLVNPNSGEEAADVLCEVLREPEGRVLAVVDSVAALVPARETEESSDTPSVAAQARLISKMMRRVVTCMKSDVRREDAARTIILLNQVRVQIGVQWGDPEISPGGRALEHYVSVRVKFRRKEHIYRELDGGGEKAKHSVGQRISFTVLKNKCGGLIQDKGVFTFFHTEEGGARGGVVDNASDILPLALLYGIVSVSGRKFSMPRIGRSSERIFAVGKDNFVKRLRETPGAAEYLAELVSTEHKRRYSYDTPTPNRKGIDW